MTSPGQTTDPRGDGPAAAGPFVESLYARLPDVLRDLDTDGHLLRYLRVALGDADDLERLADRVATDLVDPVKADAAWVPWLAQHVGVVPRPGVSVEDLRGLIIDQAGGFAGATRDAIAAAAARALTGDASVNVLAVYQGDEFTIGLQTLATQTPDPDAVVRAVEAAGARPAGFDLVVVFYAATWATMEAALPTWGAWDTVPSWQVLESIRPGGTIITRPPDPTDPTSPTSPTALTDEAGAVLTTEAGDTLTLE